ncbi:MAG TPA: tryptophan 2,3-dioxygenase family protein [Blastocatellia bacterium]|nr:tryptophan 2,3-dioxygenase family protein [Blastocatellia bacterium]
MSFGLPPRDEPRLTYGGYLKVRELISLQHLLSDPPQHDEMLFIIIHQVYELWFKELLHELDTIIERLNDDQPLAAHRLVRRCIEIERVLVDQIAVLETMMPTDFLSFRDHLMPASGFQSFQFREIEYVSGLKDARFLKNYDPNSAEYAKLEARLSQPSLADAFYAMLRRRGFHLPDVAAVSEEDREKAGQQRISELKRVYQDSEKHYELFLLTESLIEYDEMFSMWRLRHVKMVERMIGSKTGTGGSEGAAYLKKTVERTFFPELWELRSYLSKKTVIED